jgi:hypothetical protein
LEGTPQGRETWGRLFWVTFFGDAKKVTGCRSTTDGVGFAGALYVAEIKIGRMIA